MLKVTTEQVERTMQSKHGIAVINVLDAEQYNKEHIPGTDNIPQAAEDFVRRVEQKVGEKDRPVVVYCASTECDASPKAAKKLEDAGFQNVYDYEGGTKAWKETGHEVEAG